MTMDQLDWQHLVVVNKEDFLTKVRKISANLGIDPNWLMICMYGETAFTFSPSIRSGNKPGAAVGLIQFTKDIATRLGTTKDLLSQMTNVRQLDFVEQYFLLNNAKNNMKSLEDVYIVIFAPAWLGRPDSQVAYRSPTNEYLSNVTLDTAKKGFITIGDIKFRVRKWIPKKKI